MKIDPKKVNLLEADIEQYLWENPNEVAFNGWYISRWLKRQFSVPSGIIDLLGVTVEGYFVVVEIKNVDIDAKAVAQVCRYAHDIFSVITKLNTGAKFSYRYSTMKVLVGPSIGTTVLRECEACGISYLEFEVNLSLKIDQTQFTRAFRSQRDSAYAELASDPTLIEAHSAYQKHRQEGEDLFSDWEPEESEPEDEAERYYQVYTTPSGEQTDSPVDTGYSDIILG